MIPKKIHYIWVGPKEIPELEKRCMETRKKYLPDYEIVLRNESNFDFNKNSFAKKAYENKKYAFVSDYIRVWVLYNYGGIYLDTDVELIKNLDGFLKTKGFGGFERKDLITTGVVGAEKNNIFLKEILTRYENHEFNLDNLVPNPIIFTNIATEKFGFKGGKKNIAKLRDNIFTVFPENYFCPKYSRKTCLNRTDCYAIHHFTGSRMNQPQRIAKLKKYIVNILKFLGIYSFVLTNWIKVHKK